MVKLKSFAPFASTTEAVVAATSIIDSTLDKNLKKFLKKNMKICWCKKIKFYKKTIYKSINILKKLKIKNNYLKIKILMYICKY